MVLVIRGMKRDDFRDFIVDQISGQLSGQQSGLGEVTCRAMFGGYGIYSGEKFFAIVYKDRVYFKTDEATRGAYTDAGMGPFKPNEKQTLKNYYEVPPDVLEDAVELTKWAVGAVGVG